MKRFLTAASVLACWVSAAHSGGPSSQVVFEARNQTRCGEQNLDAGTRGSSIVVGHVSTVDGKALGGVIVSAQRGGEVADGGWVYFSDEMATVYASWTTGAYGTFSVLLRAGVSTRITFEKAEYLPAEVLVRTGEVCLHVVLVPKRL
jgi:hypothetical protein